MKNNLKVYLHVVKIQILKSMAYKFDVYGNILMQTIIMITTAFFWKALFKTANNIEGVNVDTMLTYTVVSSMVSVLLTTNVESRITQSVRKGTIAIDMMRPVNIFKVFFAENLGAVIALVFQNLIPIFIIGSLIIKLPVPTTLHDGVMFIVSLALAFLINWNLAVIFGMWAFKVIEMDALIQVKKHLLRLLSGSIIPIWFFPQWLQNILECLPFMYIYQLPISIYVGKYTASSLQKGIAIQFMWTVILYVIKTYLEKRATRSVMIQGG